MLLPLTLSSTMIFVMVSHDALLVIVFHVVLDVTLMVVLLAMEPGFH